MMEMLAFWARETFENVLRNRLMSLLAVSTVTVGLWVFGAFFLSIVNLRAAVEEQTQKLDLVVLLDRDLAPARHEQIVSAVRALPQTRSLEVVSAERALEAAGAEFDTPIDDLRANNPLRDELHLRLHDPADFFRVRDYLAGIRGVASVRDASADEVVSYLLALNRFVSIAALIALGVLASAILLIIHNSIRLTLFARRREIRIMQLVGATPGFVRVPFLLEGLFYGLAGALLAWLALALLYAVGAASLPPLLQSLMPLGARAALGSCALLLGGTGAAFGLLGAHLSFNHSQKSLGV